MSDNWNDDDLAWVEDNDYGYSGCDCPRHRRDDGLGSARMLGYVLLLVAALVVAVAAVWFAGWWG